MPQKVQQPSDNQITGSQKYNLIELDFVSINLKRVYLWGKIFSTKAVKPNIYFEFVVVYMAQIIFSLMFTDIHRSIHPSILIFYYYWDCKKCLLVFRDLLGENEKDLNVDLKNM